ncbi:MAG: DUF6179 domain-containing protein [Lachnospiraceae bacterium]
MTTSYEMEELVPVVAGLAGRYTAGESTSITYEKAQQLMEAVLYCIHELEQSEMESETNSVSAGKSTGKIPAEKAYCLGLECVKKKAGKTLKQYNELLPDFVFFDNRCLYDTFVKGLPRFFRWYDVEFHPQNTILTLDYPVLKDLSSYTGIDKIAAFTDCIRLEQLFLKSFPENYVRRILILYNKAYPAMIENICEPVAGAVVCHILTGKPVSEGEPGKKEMIRIRQIFLKNRLEEIIEQLQLAFSRFLADYCGDSGELYTYFAGSIRGIAVRLEIISGQVDF